MLGSNGAGKTTMLRTPRWAHEARRRARSVFGGKTSAGCPRTRSRNWGSPWCQRGVSCFPSIQCGRIWSSVPIAACGAASAAEFDREPRRCF